MLKRYRLDTETLGFTGPIVTMQINDEFYNVWRQPIEKTLALIDTMMDGEIVCYNTAYDAFHISRIYNLFRQLDNKTEPPNPVEAATIDALGGKNFLCLKPKNTIDLYVVLRQTKLKYLFKLKPIIVSKVPIQAADELINIIQQNLTLPVLTRLLVTKQQTKTVNLLILLYELKLPRN